LNGIDIDRKMANALIADKVMGFIPAKGNWWMSGYGEFNCDRMKADRWLQESERGVDWQGKKYSGYSSVEFSPIDDLESAFKVVKYLIDNGAEFKLGSLPSGEFGCRFNYSDMNYLGEGPTIPIAICKAALLTKDIKI
jgi:hypothetical protein